MAIGNIAKVYNGNSINAEEKKARYEGLEIGYPFIATKDVGVNGNVDYDNGVKIPFDTDFKVALPDSVFVCAEGGSAGKKVAHIDRKVCFGNKLFALQPIKEKVLGSFLFYAVQETGFKTQFRLLMAGIIGGVSAKKFNSITIHVPPLSEQHRIVSLLDAEFAKIDALKANAEKNLQNAKDLFQAALKKELEPKEGWKVKTLKEIGLTQTGTTPKTSVKENYGDYIPFIKPADVNIDGLGNLNYNNEGLSEQGAKSGRVFDANSILMVCIGATIGKVGYAKQKVSSNQQINVLTPYKGYNSKFLYYCMASPNFQFKVIKEGESAKATLPIINKSKWESLLVAIPAIFDQQSIVSRLDTLNEKCKALQANYEKTLSLCDDLKQALLRKAFNGEI